MRQPSSQTGLAAKRVERGNGPQVGVLHRLLSIGVIAEDAAGDAPQTSIVPLHHRGHRRLAAVTDVVDQVESSIAASIIPSPSPGLCPLDRARRERFPC